VSTHPPLRIYIPQIPRQHERHSRRDHPRPPGITKRLVIPLAFPADGSATPYPEVLKRFYKEVVTLREMASESDTTIERMFDESTHIMRFLHESYAKLAQDNSKTTPAQATVRTWMDVKIGEKEAIVKAVVELDVKEGV
jgi:hypothetical protein